MTMAAPGFTTTRVRATSSEGEWRTWRSSRTCVRNAGGCFDSCRLALETAPTIGRGDTSSTLPCTTTPTFGLLGQQTLASSESLLLIPKPRYSQLASAEKWRPRLQQSRVAASAAATACTSHCWASCRRFRLGGPTAWRQCLTCHLGCLEFLDAQWPVMKTRVRNQDSN